MARLRHAVRALRGQHVRVLTAFETRGGTRFAVNEIVQVYSVWRDRITVERPKSWPREQGRAPVRWFELAENLGPPPAKPSPPAPKRSTWIGGKLTFDGPFMYIGGEPLTKTFAEFDGKPVHVSLKVVD